MGFLKRCWLKLKHENLKFRVARNKYEYGLNATPRKEKIIVSLTSFPKRFEYLELSLKSLLLQSVKPDRIILWLGSDSKEFDVENMFQKYIQYGLEVRVDKTMNLKSHKKYIYALKEFENDLIITVDDDLIYPENLIENLLQTHEKFPDAIVARRVHKILWKNNGEIKPYLEWNGECTDTMNPSHQLFATTGAGTLFPPHSLYNECTNIDLIRNFAFSADDVWLKFMAVMQGTKVVWAPNHMQMPSSTQGAHKGELALTNVENNMNDIYIHKLMEHYKLSQKDFM